MKTYRLQSDCIVVQGYARATLCDITHRQACCIDSPVARVLQKDSFSETELHSLPVDVQQSLFEGEMIIQSKPQLLAQLPSIDEQYESPYAIEDAVVDYGMELIPYIQSIVAQLDELDCRCLQIRFLPSASIGEITDAMRMFSSSKIPAIEVIADAKTIQGHQIEDSSAQLVSIIAYSADKLAQEQRNGCTIISVVQDFVGAEQCGVVEPHQFNCNREFFFLSANHNTCLYRKLSIDREGYIRNCPACPQHFGRVGEVSLAEAMAHPDFSRLWGITKDQVDVCCDCEFRRICPDCRVFTRHPERPTAHPARCTYNPYIARWHGQLGYVPVEQCGEFTPEGFVPDAERIERVLREQQGSS